MGKSILPLMLTLLVLLATYSFSFADDFILERTTYTECENLIGNFSGQLVTMDHLIRDVERIDHLRPVYRSRSNDPEKNLIVLVSKDRNVRLDLAKAIVYQQRIPAFVPGLDVGQRQRFLYSPSLEIVRPSRINLVEAMALIENIGRLPAAFWSAGDTFLTYVDRQKQQRHTIRHNMVANLALMQSHFGYGHWAAQPLRTFFDNVERESGGIELKGEAVRRLAAIYYLESADARP